MYTATTEQIEQWKEKHGGVYNFPAEDKRAYLREPKMTDFKRAFSAMIKDGDVAFGEAMIATLWIDGDEEIKNDDEYFLPARKKMIDFFNYDDAVLTPLESKKTEITIGESKCVVRVITREDIRTAERKNPGNKPFVTAEKLFDLVCLDKDDAFTDRNNAEIRFPLYKAIEDLQNQKVVNLKKL